MTPIVSSSQLRREVRGWFVDGDGDGWGGVALALVSCDQPSGTASAGGDCYGLVDDHCGILGAGGLSDASAKLIGESSNDYAGQALSMEGDYDGDGYFDLLIGAWADDDGGSAAGAAYVLYGAPQ